MAILFGHHDEFSILVYTIHMVQENVTLFAEASLSNITYIFLPHSGRHTKIILIMILKCSHESEKPHKGCENVPRKRVTRTPAMPLRFNLGTVIMIPDALVASVVNVSLLSM